MAKYLVTGGAGFIGANLVAALVRLGHQVRILDNFSTGLRANLPTASNAEVLEGDVRSYHIVREAVDGVDFVLHEAALPSVPRSVRDPITTNDVNINGTLNVLNAARDAKVKRLVFASSSSVYGDNPVLPKHEGLVPAPLSPYAVSKLAGEQYCQVYTSLYGFDTVMLRYFNVFGPHQNPQSEYAAVIPRFMQQIANGESPVIFGDGRQTRDFTFVENVVAANLAACERDRIQGRVFNVATGTQVSLLELVGSLSALLRREVQPRFSPARPGDVKHSYASVASAREALGYVPSIDLKTGLTRMLNGSRLPSS
jgi:nucleoside-diphosphate-sugar epimerase